MRISDWSSDVCSSDLMSAYNTSKAAARMLAKTTALHCAKRKYDIRCNSVHPTFIDTPMVQEMIYAGGDPDDRRAKLAAPVPLGRLRSEGRRVGKEAVSTVRSRRLPFL